MDSSFAIPGPLDQNGLPAPSPNRTYKELPKAIDLSHHLNSIARNRTANQLKQLYKYMTVPGMITLAGGIPSPEYFPFETLSTNLLQYDTLPLDPPRKPKAPKKSILSWLFSANQTSTVTVPKYVRGADAQTLQLATSLQYQSATGPPALPLFLREYVERVYQPAYADWDVLINCGNTDAWGKICFMLLEKGDSVLVEEWTYPSAENAFLPLETRMVPIKMDGEGVIPEHMEEVLANWDPSKGRRPRVFYTIPTGQNPTGATMLGERKKAIYDICSKYDIIICEDEPYFCLYSGAWTPQSPQSRSSELSTLAERQAQSEKEEGASGRDAFIAALPPTYLRFDTEGRVIRMDTFSKTSCPGSRLGWFTASPLFIERLTRATEASTQAPSGFVTAMTTAMLQTWGFDGYIRWLRGIKSLYRMRKTWICDTFEDVFHLEFDSHGDNPLVMDILGGSGATCYAKGPLTEIMWDEKRTQAGSQMLSAKPRGPPLVSFIPPTAGMFIWLAIHIGEHPDFDHLERKGEDATRVLMEKLWQELADHLVLFAPGWAFDAHGPHAIGGKGIGYFRLAFSITTYEETRKSVETLAKVLVKFYRL